MTTICGNVVLADNVLRQGTIRIEDGRIAEVTADSKDGAELLLAYGWIVPGFIDVHVHGGNGHDFMEATPDAFRSIARFHGQHGTTSLLATTMTAPKHQIERVLQTAAACMLTDPHAGARLLGVHLEGPFISPHRPGAQNPDYIVPPQLPWLKEWNEAYPGLIRQLTLAPELNGAHQLIDYLRRHEVVVAAGHTEATYEQMRAGVERGVSQVVHGFNAMTALHHREPGVAGAMLTDPRLAVEVIADGIHVHPAVVKLLTKVKTDGNLILITDAMAAAGLGDGRYTLGELAVNVRHGEARLADGGALAGSTLTMIDAFRFMVHKIGLSVPEASRLASGNAARQLGLDDVYGTIRIGAPADLVVLDRKLDIVAVFRDGQRI